MNYKIIQICIFVELLYLFDKFIVALKKGKKKGYSIIRVEVLENEVKFSTQLILHCFSINRMPLFHSASQLCPYEIYKNL